jgi:hypothetical protein
MACGSLRREDVSLTVADKSSVCITLIQCAHARLLHKLGVDTTAVLGLPLSFLESETAEVSVQLPGNIAANEVDGLPELLGESHFVWMIGKVQ